MKLHKGRKSRIIVWIQVQKINDSLTLHFQKIKNNTVQYLYNVLFISRCH